MKVIMQTGGECTLKYLGHSKVFLTSHVDLLLFIAIYWHIATKAINIPNCLAKLYSYSVFLSYFLTPK